jgi:hypothetical protein
MRDQAEKILSSCAEDAGINNNLTANFAKLG